jgi:ABC-type bacteriocin/lantibiotic exporter with double-glycine peptidase domain
VIRKNAQRSSEKSLQHLQEALAGYVESNIYDKNEIFLHKYLRHQTKYNSYLSGQMILQGAPVRLIEIFALLGVVILIMINQWSGSAGNSAVITIGVFMAAAYKIIPGIVKMLNLSGQINTYAFTLHRLEKGLGRPNLIKPKVIRLPITAVCMKNIHFSYNGHRVVEDVSLDIEQGDFVGIAGPSGRGKTTILNILLGFLPPEKGRIFINGAEGMNEAYWARIAYVKQQSFLIHDTIRHNITLSEEPCDEPRLAAAVAGAGLSAVVESFPEGLEKVIMENGRNISGGQRQRIVLARALYKDADLIILDEPFNELDEESECGLLKHFKQLTREGKMVVLITHHKKSLSFCNKTINLHEEPS